MTPSSRSRLLVVVALSTIGCQPSGLSWMRDSTDTTTSVTSNVNLLEVDGAGLAARLAAHRGQVVMVDFWATWCPPCRKAFPHSVALGNKFAPDGLKFVAVSLDAADERDAVLQFLGSQGDNLEAYISRYGSGPRSFDEFQLHSRAIPCYQLYDRQGQLRYTFTGSSPELEQRIRELLSEPSA